jgi:bifunctional non-homologous end joining protein LigD
MSLREYKEKRNFARTSEPEGEIAKGESRRFVIQKHDASRLHYDFRLEMAGTLKSWAVPKGVPYAKGDKRLAVQVEDHPVDYATFEGLIPEGEYGGGTVMLWDTGTYEILGGDSSKDLKEGKLHFRLAGRKLNGEWTLIRTHGNENNQWLLLKTGANVRPVSRKQDDTSVKSGRSMKRIAEERDAEWTAGKTRKATRLKFVEPMKAKLVAEPPKQGKWDYELKLDGFRALALKSGGKVELRSRNDKDLTKRFPEIAAAMVSLPVENAILDGEIVALDPQGRPSFQLLQADETGKARPPILYYLFDLLQHEDLSILDEPLWKRRERLKALLPKTADPLRFSATLDGEVNHMLKEVCARGLEGLIGKQTDSTYELGQRSGAWIKLKCIAEQEFVIGGYTPPRGTRKHLGAVLIGYYEGKEFRFAGKVGSGFDTASLGTLHRKLAALHIETCPFKDLPKQHQGRWMQEITPREMKLCHWATPKLVCQIRFTEWTRDGKLRHPVFIGLREDKDARKVGRERAS